jgi:hypothetical protein
VITVHELSQLGQSKEHSLLWIDLSIKELDFLIEELYENGVVVFPSFLKRSTISSINSVRMLNTLKLLK